MPASTQTAEESAPETSAIQGVRASEPEPVVERRRKGRRRQNRCPSGTLFRLRLGEAGASSAPTPATARKRLSRSRFQPAPNFPGEGVATDRKRQVYGVSCPL